VLDSVVAALFGFPPLGRGLHLLPCYALRGIWGGATMTTPVGRAHYLEKEKK
jgi:hypothetical protein